MPQKSRVNVNLCNHPINYTTSIYACFRNPITAFLRLPVSSYCLFILRIREGLWSKLTGQFRHSDWRVFVEVTSPGLREKRERKTPQYCTAFSRTQYFLTLIGYRQISEPAEGCSSLRRVNLRSPPPFLVKQVM